MRCRSLASLGMTARSASLPSAISFSTMPNSKGTIAILTGGGDVPGLNPAIRAITIRGLREGYGADGIRRGWAGAVGYWRGRDGDNPESFLACPGAVLIAPG